MASNSTPGEIDASEEYSHPPICTKTTPDTNAKLYDNEARGAGDAIAETPLMSLWTTLVEVALESQRTASLPEEAEVGLEDAVPELEFYLGPNLHNDCSVSQEQRYVLERVRVLAKSNEMEDMIPLPLPAVTEQSHYFYTSPAYPPFETFYILFNATITLPKFNAFKGHGNTTRERYRHNILTALQFLDVSGPPDIDLLRAVSFGALIMQEMGNFSSSDEYTASAYEICVAMSHQSEIVESMTEEEVNELSVIWMRSFVRNQFHFTRRRQTSTLTVNSLRFDLLSAMDPNHTTLGVKVSLANVQDVITNSRSNDPHDYVLLAQMKRIKARIEQLQSQAVNLKDNHLRFEWLSLEAMYYSMMISVTRFVSSVYDIAVYGECLNYSRQALESMTRMLELTLEPDSLPSRCIFALTWIIPTFYKRPMFFLYRHVVFSSNLGDYNQLQTVTELMGQVAKRHHAIARIAALNLSLMRLCTQHSQHLLEGCALGVLESEHLGNQ
ncbi:hypothetical protein AUP68_12121 [Ilyonectria robusta]